MWQSTLYKYSWMTSEKYIHFDKDLFVFLTKELGLSSYVHEDFRKWELFIHDMLSVEGIRARISQLKRTDPASLNKTQKAWRAVSAYQTAAGAELLMRANAHMQKYARPLKDKVIVLVHSFYLQCGLMHKIREGSADLCRERQRAVTRYKYNTLRVLQEAKKRGYSVASFSTLYHYPFIDSYLTEKGLIDLSIFSLFDYGFPANKIEYGKIGLLEGKSVYAGGCFNGACPSTAVMSIEENVELESLKWVPELMLENPRHQFHTQKLLGPYCGKLETKKILGSRRNGFPLSVLGRPLSRYLVPQSDIMHLDDFFPET